MKICNSLSLFLSLSLSVNIQNLYCFQYTPSSEDFVKSYGWDFFKLENEFQRMSLPNDRWVLTDKNREYALCDTYPSVLYVPASVEQKDILGSSSFRSKGRLPVLTYLHPNKATICRCSQPLSGFSARCMEDEKMLEEIRKTNPNSNLLYVVDTRPRVSFNSFKIIFNFAEMGHERHKFL